MTAMTTLTPRCAQTGLPARQWLAFWLAFGFGLLLPPGVHADGLAVDPAAAQQPGLSMQNNVPVVNIVAPNAAGLSHNRYLEFNIPAQGLVFNNSTVAGTSALAGDLAANANLNGHSASLILNEVTGFNPSRLLGRAEVFGAAANLVIANPNGLYVNGAGFINTPRVTLTTGVPQFSAGALSGFNVSGGTLMLDGSALDARTVQTTDLVARNILLNAALVTGGDARLYAGQGIWQYASGSFSNSGNTSSGALAIDASNLGAMSAGRIFIVANEQGAGVRLSGDMSATADDIEISAKGDLLVRNVHAARDVDLTSSKGVALSGTLLSGKDTTIDAQNLVITGNAASSQRLSLHVTQDFLLSGQVAAGSALNLDEQGAFINQGLFYSAGDLNLQAASVDNSDGLLIGERAVSVSTLSTGISNSGGVIYGGTGLTVTTATDIDNSDGGQIGSDGALNLFVVGDLSNGTGSRIAANGNVRLLAGGAVVQDGLLQSAGNLTLRALSLQNGGDTLASGNLDIRVNRDLLLTQGRVSAGGSATLLTQGRLQNAIAVASGADMTLTATGTVDNSGQFDSLGLLTVTAGGLVTNSGRFYGNAVDISLPLGMQNSGLIAAEQDLFLHQDVPVANDGSPSPVISNSPTGRLLSNGTLALTTHSLLDNHDGGQVLSLGDMDLRASLIDNHGGQIQSNVGLHMTLTGEDLFTGGPSLDNSSGGKVIAGDDLGIDWHLVQDGSLLNTSGLVQSGRDLTLQGSYINSFRGDIVSARDLTITADHLYNPLARLASGGNATITLTGDFQAGRTQDYQFLGDLSITASNYITLFQDMSLNAGGNLTLNVAHLQGLLAKAGGDIVVNTPNVSTFWEAPHYTWAWLANQLGGEANIDDSVWESYWQGSTVVAGSDRGNRHRYVLQAGHDIRFNVTSLNIDYQNQDYDSQGNSSSVILASSLMAGHDVLITASSGITFSDSDVLANHDIRISSSGLWLSADDLGACHITCQMLAGNDIVLSAATSDPAEFANRGVIEAGRDLVLQGMGLYNRFSYPAETDAAARGGFVGAGRDFIAQYPAGMDASLGNEATVAAGRDVVVDMDAGRVTNLTPTVRTAQITAARDVLIAAPDVDNSSGLIAGGVAYVPAVPVSSTMVAAPDLGNNSIGGAAAVTGYNGGVILTPGGGPGSHGGDGGLLGDAGQGPGGIQLPGWTPPFTPGTGTGGNTGGGTGGNTGGNTGSNGTSGGVRAAVILPGDAVILSKAQRTDSLVQTRDSSTDPVSDNGDGRVKAFSASAAGLGFIIPAVADTGVVLPPSDGRVYATVLMPTVAPAVIQPAVNGGSVTIVARDSFRNSGLVTAGDVAISSDSVLSQLGTLNATDRLVLQAGGNLDTSNASLNGSVVALTGNGVNAGSNSRLSADSLLINAGSSDITSLLGPGWSVRKDLIAQTQGSILATGGAVDVSGDIVLDAGKNLVLKGSALSAGNTLSLNAGGNLDLLANLTSGWSFSQGLEDQFASSQTRLKAGCDLNVSAGGNVTAQGAQLSSGCDTGISAGGDVTLTSQAVTRSNTTYTDRGWQTISDTGQLQSGISSAGALAIQSGGDLELTATRVKTSGDTQLLAGGDVTLGSALDTHSDTGKAGKRAITTWDNSSISHVVTDLDVGGDLLVNVGKGESGMVQAGTAGAVTSLGANISTGGESYLYGSTINLLAVKDAVRNSTTKTKKKKIIGITVGSSSSSSSSLQELLQSSDLIAGDDVSLMSRSDINLIASNVSGKNITLAAGSGGSGNINILGDTQASELITTYQKTHLTLGALVPVINPGLLLDGQMHDVASVSKGGTHSLTEEWVGSSLTASENLNLSTPGDVTVVGSQLSADGNAALQAGGNVNLIAGTGSHSDSSYNEKYGVGAQLTVNEGGISIFAGAHGNRQQDDAAATQAVGSTVKGDNVSITAGGDINQIGSSAQSGRDLIMEAGRDINSVAAVQGSDLRSFNEDFRVGVKAGIYQNISGSARNAYDAAQNLGNGENTVSQASGALRAVDSINQLTQSSVSASIGVLAEYARQSQQSGSTQSIGSSLQAGQNLIQQAGRDIDWQGTNALAFGDASLTAGRNLVLQSSQNTSSSSQSQRSGSVEYDLLSTDGQALNLGYAQGNYRSGSVSQNNTDLYALGNLALKSGQDTTVAGANVSGASLAVDAGGNLTVSSRQDTSTQDGSNFNIGVGHNTGSSTNLSLGGGVTTGDRAWVTDQTSLIGRDSATVTVKDTTTVNGAILGSTTDKGLTLTTGALVVTDIHDYDTYHNTQLGIGGVNSPDWSNNKPAQSNDKGQDSTGGSPRVDGTYQSSDREQIDRGTLTTGSVVVTGQTQAQTDAQLAGINRDLGKAQEITKDESTTVDIYASASSVDALTHPVKTAEQWQQAYEEKKALALQGIDKAGAVYQSLRTGIEQALVNLPPDIHDKMGVQGEALLDDLIAANGNPENAIKMLSDPDMQTYLARILAIKEKVAEATAGIDDPVEARQRALELLAPSLSSDPSRTAVLPDGSSVNLITGQSAGMALLQDINQMNQAMQRLQQQYPEAYKDGQLLAALATVGPVGLMINASIGEALSGTPLAAKLGALSSSATNLLANNLTAMAHGTTPDVIEQELIVASAASGTYSASDRATAEEVNENAEAAKTAINLIMQLATLGKPGESGAAKGTVKQEMATGEKSAVNVVDDAIEKPSLLDAKAEQHTLSGDSSGGGHRPGTGKPGKSEFPAGWSDEKIKGELSDIATDPATKWSKPDSRGYVSGVATRDGVEIKVIYDTKKGRIVTGYPINLPRNP